MLSAVVLAYFHHELQITFFAICMTQMSEYIQEVHGFEKDNITILMDDGVHTEPTKENILAAYEKLVSESEDGDVVFCHFSGKLI